MTNTLITFLGKENPNSGYDQARYKFEDSQNESGLIINNDRNVSKRAPVFGVALYTHLKNKLNKFIVVGTTGSEWLNIYHDEIIENSDEIAKYFSDISSIQESHCTESEKLVRIQENLTKICSKNNSSKTSKVKIYLKAVNDNMKYDDHIDIFKAINSEIPKNDHVTLDTTHGYRIMPLLGSSIVQYLKLAKNVTIDHIYYAWKKEQSNKEEPIEIIDMRALLELNEWSSSFAKYDKSGDLSCFSELLVNTKIADEYTAKTINKASFTERLLNVDSTAELPALSKCVNTILENDNSAIFNVVKDQYKERIGNWIDNNKDYVRKINCAKSYLDCGDYLRSVIYLFEGLIEFYKNSCLLTNSLTNEEIEVEKKQTTDKDKFDFWKLIAFKIFKDNKNAFGLSDEALKKRIDFNIKSYSKDFCENFES